MEDIHSKLIQQVKTWLEEKKLVDADRQMVYQNFIGQCEQFGISEEEFYLDILRPAYRDAYFDLSEDPDPKNEKHTHVTIFGQKLHSLKKLGQVLFDNFAKSAVYFEDTSLIKNHVDTLASGDDALEYAKIYKEEPNPEKRYLKIVYHLNPKLPYRIGDQIFNTLEDIFHQAFQSHVLYSQFYNEYASGRLAVWLTESNPDQAGKISGGNGYNSFLRFIYRVNVNYPFYLSEELFSNPQEIVDKARKNLAFREEVYSHLVNEQLFIWFDCIGKSDWQVQYSAIAERLALGQLTGDDLVHASVQKLIRIIDPSIPAPKISISHEHITYTQLEASKLLVVSVKLKLATTGYVQFKIEKDSLVDGISIDRSSAIFFDLAKETEVTFNLVVNPLLLTKDKLYSFNINIVTDDEKLKIPVQIKTVFPLKTFLVYLGKYAAFGFIILASIRYALQAFTKNNSWLEPKLIVSDFDNALPADYLAYLGLFLILFVALIAVYPLIKKVEKI